MLDADGILIRTNSLQTTTPVFSRNYYIRDHLGNIRVVFDENGIIKQVNHFYPFGMEFGESAEDQTEVTYQNYLFGGKEFDRTYELNTSDFGARNLDGTRGQWTTPDPLAEKYYSVSPYAYCMNNPVRITDPNGMEVHYNWIPYGSPYAQYNGDEDWVIQYLEKFKSKGVDMAKVKVKEKADDDDIKTIDGAVKKGNAAGQGDEFNICEDISNSFLVGAATNQHTYFRTSQIAKENKFAVDGWKTYSNAFKGNQHVSSVSVKEAKAAFNSVLKATSRISTGLTLVNFGVTYANYAAGNVSDGRYYVQQTINVIGLFGPWGAGIAIGLGTVDAILGDQIERSIRE